MIRKYYNNILHRIILEEHDFNYKLLRMIEKRNKRVIKMLEGIPKKDHG